MTSFEAPVGHALAGAGSKVLGGLGKGLGAVQHVYRAAQFNSDKSAMSQGISPQQQQSAGMDPNPVHGAWNIFSPSEWASAWRSTANGPKTFNPSVIRQLQAQNNPQDMKLAERLASGESEASVVNAAPATQTRHARPEAPGPRLSKLVTQLNNAHITLGHAVVGEKFMNDHPAAGKVASGAIDAAYDWYADPLNLPVTKAVTGIRELQYGIDSKTAASYIVRDASEGDAFSNPGWSDYMSGRLANAPVSRAIQTAGDMLQKGQGSAFRTVFARNIGPLYDQLVADGVNDADGLRDWLSSQAGLKAVLEGRAGRSASGVTLLPHLSPIGLARTGVRGALRTSLDNLIDNPHELSKIDVTKDSLVNTTGPLGEVDQADPSNLEELTDRSGWNQKIGTAVRGGVTRVARLTRTLGTLTPSGAGVDLSDPNSFDHVRKSLLYSLPVRTVDQIGEFYVHAGTDERFQIIQAAKAQMLHYAGAFANGDSSQRIMEMMQEGYRNEAYAGQGLDKMATGGRQGLLETQMSTRVALPNLYDVHPRLSLTTSCSAWASPSGCPARRRHRRSCGTSAGSPTTSWESGGSPCSPARGSRCASPSTRTATTCSATALSR